MEEMKDMIAVCLYCGDLMEAPTEKQLELFGWPSCCEAEMVKMDRDKLFKLVKGLDNLKVKLEAEMIKGLV